MLTIKKYRQRKLHVLGEGRDITTIEVLRMVRDGVKFRIIDQETEADITLTVLNKMIAPYNPWNMKQIATFLRANADEIFNEEDEASLANGKTPVKKLYAYLNSHGTIKYFPTERKREGYTRAPKEHDRELILD